MKENVAQTMGFRAVLRRTDLRRTIAPKLRGNPRIAPQFPHISANYKLI